MNKQICKTELCTGCAACMNVCCHHAIDMYPDNKGFLRPTINAERCLDCGACRAACPQNSRIAPERAGSFYAALAIDDALRKASSSGGIFSLLAEWTLSKHGVVFGAALEEDLKVRHIMVDSIEKLPKLRGSKYVQSEIGRAYQEVERQLKQGKTVLFSGTPCQVYALKHFLRTDYDNLLTVDILCHGVPSPTVLHKFLVSKERNRKAHVVGIDFRAKDPGWSTFSTMLYFNDGTKEIDNSYYYFFVRNYCLRDSCAHCLYACTERVGDITLGDFWGYQESAPEHIENDDLGISLVSVNTKRGQAAFQRISSKLDSAPRTAEDAVKGNRVLIQPFVPHEFSHEFWNDFPVLEWDELVEKYGISREKMTDTMSAEDRAYYARPYKQRHARHLVHCAKNKVLGRLKRFL